MIRRFDLGTDRHGGIGSPGITEQPDGKYVLRSDYDACVAHNEMLLARLRLADSQLEAIGAGGVSLMGDRHAPHWYAVDNSGMATLCADEQDAHESAIEFAETWPNRSPYVVGRVVAVDVGEQGK